MSSGSLCRLRHCHPNVEQLGNSTTLAGVQPSPDRAAGGGSGTLAAGPSISPKLRIQLSPRAAATALGLLLQRTGTIGSIVLFYLIATLISAIAYDLGPSLFASGRGVLCYGFFFLAPIYSLSIADSGDTVRLAVFAIVGFVASNVAARVRRHAINADQRVKACDQLYRLAVNLLAQSLCRMCCAPPSTASSPYSRRRSCCCWRRGTT